MSVKALHFAIMGRKKLKKYEADGSLFLISYVIIIVTLESKLLAFTP